MITESFTSKRWSSLTTFALLIVLSLVAANRSPAQSESDAQAQLHFRVAQAAIKNNDMKAAEEELILACKAAPKMALLYYNLAVVQEKQNERLAAKTSLDRALQLGVPTANSDAAQELLATLTYELRNYRDIRPAAGDWGGDECSIQQLWRVQMWNRNRRLPEAKTTRRRAS